MRLEYLVPRLRQISRESGVHIDLNDEGNLVVTSTLTLRQIAINGEQILALARNDEYSRIEQTIDQVVLTVNTSIAPSGM